MWLQPNWFEGNDTALVLFWSNMPQAVSVRDVLTLACQQGLDKVVFRFFEEYYTLFDSFDHPEVLKECEMYKEI